MRFSPHAVTLRQLQYVVAVADLRSFGHAAEACGVSQPSLSAQVAQVEDAAGTRLFERDRRRVLLTPAGEVLVAQARRVLAEADEWMDAAVRLRDPLNGCLRIGVIPTVSPYWLPAVAPALRQRFPRLQVVWVEDKTAALLAAIDRGQLDAGVMALEADLGDVAHAVVGRDPFVLATARGDPLGKRASLADLAELEEAQVLLLDDGHCFRDQVLALCSRAGAREREFRATSLSTLSQMVAAGAGVTLLPLISVPVECRGGELSIRAFADPAPGRTLALVWRRGSPLEAALQRVAQTMREAFGRLQARLQAEARKLRSRAPAAAGRGRRGLQRGNG